MYFFVTTTKIRFLLQKIVIEIADEFQKSALIQGNLCPTLGFFFSFVSFLFMRLEISQCIEREYLYSLNSVSILGVTT